MSDFDLDRLGDVWRQQPDPAEMERLRRTAIAVAASGGRRGLLKVHPVPALPARLLT